MLLVPIGSLELELEATDLIGPLERLEVLLLLSKYFLGPLNLMDT